VLRWNVFGIFGSRRGDDTNRLLSSPASMAARMRAQNASSMFFRRYWRWKSRSLGGRPQVEADLRALIRRMSVDNPLWGAPRIHGELLKLGFEVAQFGVSRTCGPAPSWAVNGTVFIPTLPLRASPLRSVRMEQPRPPTFSRAIKSGFQTHSPAQEATAERAVAQDSETGAFCVGATPHPWR
jgi:hypothetical protein